ncbi:MAG: MBL fold metallo-hydrolase, partial [Myxococcaceae bacterium]|nr:MBL fold metallo-hydrolase [Myxococcaceae bacterium]
MARGLGALLVLAVAGALVDGWRAFGRRADGERRARMEKSPQWRDGHFVNPQPMLNDFWGSVTGAFNASKDSSPTIPVPTVRGGHERFDTPPPTGLRVTWLGHSSLLVEVDGYRILTDPVWGERASPLSTVGPKRWYAPLLALGELPKLDAIVISHDHYDHLDEPTLSAMKDWDTTFIVPLGVGAHLTYWGVPASRIIELDWWERTKVKGLEIVATPSRHASGRALIDTNATLWASYAFIGPTHRVWFSGDTGLFPALRDIIGERLGPFDLTMIESGAYGNAWPDWHLGPEQAVTAHQLVRVLSAGVRETAILGGKLGYGAERRSERGA